MSTDLFLKRIWMAALLLWLMPLARAEKPNVLLLLVDDLKPAMGCYGDRRDHAGNGCAGGARAAV